MGLGISSGYSGMVEKPNDQSKVEAKYPAILFKQHLTAYVEKIYGMIRDSLKKEISPFLNLCIQVRITRSNPNYNRKLCLHKVNLSFPLAGTKIHKD